MKPQSGTTTIAAVIVVLAVTMGGCGFVYDNVGGAFRGEPQDMMHELSPGARQLLSDALHGIDPDRFVDHHIHGITSNVNDEWRSWLHPLKRARFRVYLSAAGVDPQGDWTAEYVERLLRLIRHTPLRGKYHLLALDRYHYPDGRADEHRTALHVPNQSVFDLSLQHPDVFVPVISVHPYRVDAIPELELWARRGVRRVKWLPNSMGMDPSSPRCDEFYRTMRRWDMVLYTHTGAEKAVAADHEDFGNPLLLRRPLDMGVRVVALHAASAGLAADLDDADRPSVAAFDLLVRMMENPKYDGLLFAETSAMTFIGHAGRPLEVLLSRPDLQEKFVHGSDYPFVAVNWAISMRDLVGRGFLTEEQRRHLEEIYNFNPLLFDVALKRTVRHPVTGGRLSAEMFMRQ